MSSLASYLDPAIIQQVGRLDLRARFIVEGFLAGLHSSPFHGFSVEFSEHRKYVHGDEPRLIDWHVFGRTDRLFIRKYAAETHLACHLLVDVSASMRYGDGPMTKYEYGCTVAAQISGKASAACAQWDGRIRRIPTSRTGRARCRACG